MTYFDKIVYLFPSAQGFVYWHTQQDGTPWDNPYDGLVFENPNFDIPTQETLDALDETVVATELAARTAIAAKQARYDTAKVDDGMKAAYFTAKAVNSDLTFSHFLDNLDAMVL